MWKARPHIQDSKTSAIESEIRLLPQQNYLRFNVDDLLMEYWANISEPGQCPPLTGFEAGSARPTNLFNPDFVYEAGGAPPSRWQRATDISSSA